MTKKCLDKKILLAYVNAGKGNQLDKEQMNIAADYIRELIKES
jgi:hypothetical protein